MQPITATRYTGYRQRPTWRHGATANGKTVCRSINSRTLKPSAVQTMNSLYEITIVSGHSGDVLVRGGQFFPEKTPVHLAGATFGGSFLKLRGIYLGMRMEFLHKGRRIVTSPVRRIGIAM